MRIFIFFFASFFFGFFVPGAVSAESLGEKADIMEASFDKPSYQKGDAIIVHVRWEAHGFKVASRNSGEGERLVADLAVFLPDGISCGPSVSKSVFSEDTEFLISTIASSDCSTPQARITFVGADSKLLDATAISAVSDVQEATSQEVSVDEGQGVIMKDDAAYIPAQMQSIPEDKKLYLWSGVMIAVALSVVGFVVLIAVLVWRARKRGERNF